MCQYRACTGPVLATNGMFTGYIVYRDGHPGTINQNHAVMTDNTNLQPPYTFTITETLHECVV